MNSRVTALRKTEATFQQVIESAPDGMVLIDRNGAMILVNSQTERIFGHTPHETPFGDYQAYQPDTDE